MDLLETLALPPEVVAPLLLGAVLSSTSPEGTASIRVTEVEAYSGLRDPASHAYRRKTTRNAPMFSVPGTLYVYHSYGMHWCLNIACEPDGVAAAVLIRAGDVVEGEDLVRSRRTDVPSHRLASGPGNVGAALGLTGEDSGDPLGERVMLDLPEKAAKEYLIGPRIGITRGLELPWRFATGDRSVSASKRDLHPAP